jgi:group I intron endonuclease
VPVVKLVMALYSRLIKNIEDTANISSNGVYKIYHLSKPHLAYIGSSCRYHKKRCKKGMYGRWIEHHSMLKNGNHHSIYLQRVVDKYGLDGLRFEGLYFSDEESLEQIRKREEEYIIKFDSFKNGYNASEKTSSITYSEETRLSSSNRMKVKNPMFNKDTIAKVRATKEEFYTPKYVLQYTIEGDFIKRHKDSVVASISVGVDSSNINRAANGITRKAANSLWIFEEAFSEELLQCKINNLNVKHTMTKETIEKLSIINNKAVICIELESLCELEFISIKECAEELGLDRGAVSKCCNGIQKRVKNYKIRFK